MRPFDVAYVQRELPERRIAWFPSVASTMIHAAQLARDGCPSGTVVGAEEQTAGEGRQGHSWQSEASTGLYVSIVLRVPVETNALTLMMLALGLAAQEAIELVSGLPADLRWPNDVLVGGRKCAGILAYLEGDAVIAGIGINVNQLGFPEELEKLATSLRMAGGAPVSREALLVALVRAVESCCKMLQDEGASALLRMFTRASSYASGRRVQVEQDRAIIEGTTCGLDPSGFLVIREDNGKETTILAGGVRPV